MCDFISQFRSVGNKKKVTATCSNRIRKSTDTTRRSVVNERHWKLFDYVRNSPSVTPNTSRGRAKLISMTRIRFDIGCRPRRGTAHDPRRGKPTISLRSRHQSMCRRQQTSKRRSGNKINSFAQFEQVAPSPLTPLSYLKPKPNATHNVAVPSRVNYKRNARRSEIALRSKTQKGRTRNCSPLHVRRIDASRRHTVVAATERKTTDPTSGDVETRRCGRFGKNDGACAPWTRVSIFHHRGRTETDGNGRCRMRREWSADADKREKKSWKYPHTSGVTKITVLEKNIIRYELDRCGRHSAVVR